MRGMALELRDMALTNSAETLAYLFELAAKEAALVLADVRNRLKRRRRVN